MPPRGLVGIMEGFGTKRLRPGGRVREPVVRGRKGADPMRPERPDMNEFGGGGTRPAGIYSRDEFLALGDTPEERAVLEKLYPDYEDFARREEDVLRGTHPSVSWGEWYANGPWDDPEMYNLTDDEIRTLWRLADRRPMDWSPYKEDEPK